MDIWVKRRKVKSFTVLIIFFCIFNPLRADWQEKILSFLNKAHEFRKVVQYIEKELPTIPLSQRSAAVIILCYSYKELRDRVNEEKWINHYFSNHSRSEPGIDFLNTGDEIKIYEYLNFWTTIYPMIHRITISESHKKVNYYEYQDKLKIIINLSAPAFAKIYNDKKSLFTGYLQKGKNPLSIPLIISSKTEKQLIKIDLKTGFLEITKIISVDYELSVPKEGQLNLSTKELSIIGEQFRPEIVSNFNSHTYGYFDKEFFFKKVIFNLGVGLGLFLLDQWWITNQLDNPNLSGNSQAFYNGLDQSTKVVSIGLSLKGIFNLIKCFKKRTSWKESQQHDPIAKDFNRQLKAKITHLKNLTNIHFTVSIKKD